MNRILAVPFMGHEPSPLIIAIGLLKQLRCPDAELGGPFIFDLEADSDDGPQIIVFGIVVFAVSGSYSKISNN